MSKKPELVVGTHLPRHVRRQNMRWMRLEQKRERKSWEPQARKFWDRCWSALMLHIEKLEQQNQLPPSQEFVDQIMARIAHLTIEIQAKYADAPDENIIRFVGELIQKQIEKTG